MNQEKLNELIEKYKAEGGEIVSADTAQRSTTKPFMRHVSTKRSRVVEYIKANSPVTANKVSIDTGVARDYVVYIAKDVGLELAHYQKPKVVKPAPMMDAAKMLMQQEKELTIEEVVEKAGVSKSTARKAAKQLGYLFWVEEGPPKLSPEAQRVIKYADGSRTAKQVQELAECSLGFVYYAAEMYDLKLKKPPKKHPRRKRKS